MQLRVAELLDDVAARTPAPGGGASAAVVAALAAGLVAMAGRFADPVKIPADLVDRADALRARVGPLADADAAAYGDYLAATRLPREPDPAARTEAMQQALSAASDVPMAILQAAAEVADLGRQLLVDGNPRVHGDAAAGVLLAAAVAETATLLVAENLGSTDDPRSRRAAVLVAGTRAIAADVHPGAS